MRLTERPSNAGLVDLENCSGTQYLIDLLAIQIWLTSRFLCVDNYFLWVRHMSAPRKSIANLYLYDPLNRLTGVASAQRFYNGTRIATEIQNNRKICFFEHEAMPLAELHLGGAIILLATDQQTSTLNGVSAEISQPQSYSPYGHRPTTNGLLTLLCFNGERPDSATGHYLLGQGYRAFNPVLMRFNSPDKLSPFDKGGINSYAYCGGDPINYKDPTGHSRGLVNLLKKYRPPARIPRVGKMKNKPEIPSDGYVFAAFHGTSQRHVKSLKKGLKPSYAGSENGQTDGAGFYATPDYSFAHSFAREVIVAENKTLKRSIIFPFENFSRDPVVRSTSTTFLPHKPVVLGVYVKGYHLKKPGKNFSFVRGEENPLKSSELVFPMDMYDDIIIRDIDFQEGIPEPWVANLNIRKI